MFTNWKLRQRNFYEGHRKGGKSDEWKHCKWVTMQNIDGRLNYTKGWIQSKIFGSINWMLRKEERNIEKGQVWWV